MKRRLLSVIMVLLFLGTVLQPQTAQAADYLFEVTRAQVNFFINKDGTVSLEYTYDFYARPGGADIEYVDIGVPPSNAYDLKNVSAEVNGKKITDIQASDVVKPGIAFGLGANSIRANNRGTFHARIEGFRKVIFESDLKTEKVPYASISVSPNWYSPANCKGITDFTFNIMFPADLQAEEPRYHIPQYWPGPQAPFTGVDQTTGLKFYSWQFKTANMYTQYIFGASFPARLVPAGVVQSKPWITLPPAEDLILYGFCGFMLLFFGSTIYGAIWGARSRKLKYLPPKVAIEGMGIKRGLTAVEAAILMEQPMDKILTMILFGVVKKGAATVISKEPLTIQNTDPLPAGLFAYETDFLAAFKEEKLAERRKGLQTMMIGLVKTVTEKMKGFSRKETVDYYENIMKQAWQQVESAATPEVKMEAFDTNLDWALLDRRFDDRTRDVFHSGPVFVPVWWNRYDPVFASHSSPTPSLGMGGGQPIQISRPSVPGSDFAASVVNSVQGFAAGAVGDVTSFTGGVTDKTNPVPVSSYASGSSRGGSSSGGHSCACACACAGCACACAGGGR